MFCTPIEQKDSVKNIFASANHLSDAFTRSLGAATSPALKKGMLHMVSAPLYHPL